MTHEQKAWIDGASYEDLLYKTRFEPIGSPWFAGECGIYFESVVSEKRAAAGVDGHIAASKSIGWEGPSA